MYRTCKESFCMYVTCTRTIRHVLSKLPLKACKKYFLASTETCISFLLQLSFASTATTIVSGAVAERVKLHSYIVFAMFNTVAYAIPAHWIWGGGFLNKRGVVDIAGSGGAHTF